MNNRYEYVVVLNSGSQRAGIVDDAGTYAEAVRKAQLVTGFNSIDVRSITLNRLAPMRTLMLTDKQIEALLVVSADYSNPYKEDLMRAQIALRAARQGS